MATEKQIEANRRNALKSRGPRTQEGKDRSRQNALKHGLTAETLGVLPNEDPSLFEGRVDSWLRDLGVRNEVEDALIRRAATQSWKLERFDRCEASISTKRIHDQAEVDQAAHRERIPQWIDRLFPTIEQVRQTGIDPTPTAKILRELESTARGCRWILECWEQFKKLVDDRGHWTLTDELLLVRLMGHGHITIDNAQVIDLMVASRVLMRPNVALDADRWDAGPYSLRLDRDALRDACRRRPTTRDEAARVLGAAIDKGITRMEIVLNLRERDGDDWGAEESANRAAFDPSAEGERLRRYQTTTQRDMIRILESVSKLRLEAMKLEKEEAKRDATRSIEPDPAFLRNEPNPAIEAEDPEEPTDEATDAEHPEEPTGEATVRQADGPAPVLLRNEPKFDREVERGAEIPSIGQGAESEPIPLRRAS